VLFSGFTHLNTHSYLPLFTFQLRNLRTFYAVFIETQADPHPAHPRFIR
jgi:hypothetical protein